MKKDYKSLITEHVKEKVLLKEATRIFKKSSVVPLDEQAKVIPLFKGAAATKELEMLGKEYIELSGKHSKIMAAYREELTKVVSNPKGALEKIKKLSAEKDAIVARLKAIVDKRSALISKLGKK